MSTTRPSTSSVDAFTTERPITWCQKYWPAGSATASSRRIVTSLPRSVSAAFRSATSVSFRRMWGGCDRDETMVWATPSIRRVLPRLKRSSGKSVTMRHFSSPRTPWGARIWATTRTPSDDVEVDASAFSRGGRLDKRAETADDTALSADDFADVFLIDFELVDGGVAILNLVDFNRVGLIDERPCNVFNQT